MSGFARGTLVRKPRPGKTAVLVELTCTRGPDSMTPCCEIPFVRMVHHKTEEVVGVPNGSYSHRGGGHDAWAPLSPLALVLYALMLPWLTSTIVMGAEVPIFW